MAYSRFRKMIATALLTFLVIGSPPQARAEYSAAELLREADEAWKAGESAEAESLYEQACNLNDADACLYLGIMRAHHSAANRDPAAAIPPLKMACDAQLADACAALGQMAVEGDGMPADLQLSLSYLRRACAAGNEKACAAADKLASSAPPIWPAWAFSGLLVLLAILAYRRMRRLRRPSDPLPPMAYEEGEVRADGFTYGKRLSTNGKPDVPEYIPPAI